MTTRTLIQVITAEFDGVYRRELDARTEGDGLGSRLSAGR